MLYRQVSDLLQITCGDRIPIYDETVDAGFDRTLKGSFNIGFGTGQI